MPLMQVLLKLSYRIFSCFLLLKVCLGGWSVASDWQLSGFELHTDENQVRLQLDALSFQEAVSLQNIQITCPRELSVYPVVACADGLVNFRYLQHEYVFKIALDYDLQQSEWAFTVHSIDNTIAIQGDSKKRDEIFVELKGYDLAQFSEDYADLDVQLPQGKVDIQARIDLKNDTIQLDQYRLQGLSWESKDGEYIFADMGFVGDGVLTFADAIHVQLNGAITQGESLLGQIYTNYENIPLAFESSNTLSAGQLQTDVKLSLEDVFTIHANLESADLVNIHRLDGNFSVTDLEQLNALALSQALDVFGLPGTDLSGQLQGHVLYVNGAFENLQLSLDDFYMENVDKKLAASGMQGTIQWSPEQSMPSQIAWESMLLAGTPLSQTAFEFEFIGDQILFQPLIDLPVFDGSIRLKNLEIQQLFGPELGVSLEAEVLPISLRQVTEKMGWPVMSGTISGLIPGMRKNGQIIDFDGALDIQAFSGNMQINNLSMERLFGVAPVIAADVEFSDFDLQELTNTLDFGEITGRLFGTIQNLRITNWQTDRMNGFIYTEKQRGVKQTISQKALDRISSLGGIQGAISNSFLRFFSNFRYKKIALSCELVDAVCLIGGIKNKNGGFVIVQGGGIPEINILGFRRRINWHEFVDRLLNANYAN